MDEHSKLARIAVDLPPGREDAFQINVAKMNVVVPEALRPDLRALASSVVAEAQRSYREHAGDGATTRTSPNDPSSPRERGVAFVEPHVSRHWLAITRIVNDELGDDPVLRDRLLLRLANAPEDSGGPATSPGFDEDPQLAVSSG